MPIRAKCPGCAAVIGAPEAAAGKKVKCPKCGGLIPVPEPDVVSDFEVVEDDAPPPAARPVVAKAVAVKAKPADDPGFEVMDDDEPPPKPKKKPPAVVADDDEDDEDDDDEDDDRPRKKGKKAGGPPWLLIRLAILLVVGAALIGGVYLFKFGGNGSESPAAGDAAGKAGGGSKYTELNDPVGGFSVLLPGTAAKADSPIPGLQGSTWKVAASDPKPVTVRVGSLTLPPGVVPAGGANAAAALTQLDPRMIDGAKFKKEKQEDKLLGGKMGTVVTLSPATPAGTPGRAHFVIALVFGDGGKVFYIEIESPDAADPQLVSTVLNSFRIL